MSWKVILVIYFIAQAKQSSATDTFPRIHYSVANSNRLAKFVVTSGNLAREDYLASIENMSFSTEKIKGITTTCAVCAEMKLSFYSKNQSYVFKVTQPFKRFNTNFKSFLPTSSRNRYTHMTIFHSIYIYIYIIQRQVCRWWEWLYFRISFRQYPCNSKFKKELNVK